MRYVSYATKPSSPVNTWNRDGDNKDPRTGGDSSSRRTSWDHNDGNDSGSGKDWDRGHNDHNSNDDHNADCRRFSNGNWRCSGHNGHSDGRDRDDALRKYLRLRPIIYPAPIFYPGRPPVILGGKGQDIDIDVKNVYNIEQPDDAAPETMPTSGGRNVPPPVDPTPTEVQGGFSLAGLPSWGLPAIALGGVLVLVLLMKK